MHTQHAHAYTHTTCTHTTCIHTQHAHAYTHALPPVLVVKFGKCGAEIVAERPYQYAETSSAGR